MGPEAEERFEKIELKLSEHDEKIIAHDRNLTAIKNLLRTGIRMLVAMETKMAALMDSQVRLYEAQRFLDRGGDGHPA